MRTADYRIILILRLLSALPFAVFYASLQLYLENTPNHSLDSVSLVGSVIALNFGLALIGSYLLQKKLSYKFLFLSGIIAQAISSFLFTSSDPSLILWFCSFFLYGSTTISISLNMAITEKFQPDDTRRENTFYWMYLALNIGYFIGYSLSGYALEKQVNYIIPCVIIGTTLLSTLIYIKFIREKTTSQQLIINMITPVLLIIALRLLLTYARDLNDLLLLLWLFVSCIMLVKLLTTEHLRNIIIFYCLLLSAVIFWSIYFLAPMGLMLFIKNQVNLNLHGFQVAPQWVQNVNTIVIILGTIYFGKKTLTINDASILLKRFSAGLLLLCLGFVSLSLGIKATPASAHVNLLWVIVSYILQSIGELTIGPIGFALAGRLIPKPQQNIMLAIWIGLLGISSILASKLSKLTPYQSKHSLTALHQYYQFFNTMSLALLTSAIILIIFYFSLKPTQQQP